MDQENPSIGKKIVKKLFRAVTGYDKQDIIKPHPFIPP